MLMIDIEGTELTEEDIRLLAHPRVGALIFFKRNYLDLTQLKALVRAIRAVRPDILLAVDQEGGRVQRFGAPFTKLPPLADIGKQSESVAEELGWLMAAEILSVGIDFSFAPILDLQNSISKIIGDRAFHASPHKVATFAEAYIAGMHRAGMIAVGKHFPGHGSIAPDSHFDLPVDERSLEALSDDMYPFKVLIAKGIDALMPAHILYPKVDNLPVGFSKRWLIDILRNELQFSGVIISDDLSMAGACVVGTPIERVQKGYESGAELLLLCNDRSAVLSVLQNPILEDMPDTRASVARLRGKSGATWETLQASNQYQAARALCEGVVA